MARVALIVCRDLYVAVSMHDWVGKLVSGPLKPVGLTGKFLWVSSTIPRVKSHVSFGLHYLTRELSRLHHRTGGSMACTSSREVWSRR